MSRAIDAQQSEFRHRSDLHRVDLIRLTTYADREFLLVDTRFYFAKQNVRFDWGKEGTEREFWPLLREIGDLRVTMNHLPDPADTNLFSKPLEIVLSNEPFQGDRLINILRNGHTLANATIEWTQVLTAERPTGPRIDLTALAGDEHTFWYRGRVVRVGPVTNDSITLACEVDLPRPDFLRATDPLTVDPKDIGRRVPCIYGAAEKVPCINWDVGFATTLAEEIDGSQSGSIQFTDTTGFADVGTGMIGSESITWTGKTATTLTGVVRGASGTNARAHAAGEVLTETIATATFLAAGDEVSAINNVYALSPFTGLLTRLTTPFTKNTADSTTEPGRRVATIVFTAGEMRQAIQALALEARVTQQAPTGGEGNITQKVLTEGVDAPGNPNDREAAMVANDETATAGPWYVTEDGDRLETPFADPLNSFTNQTYRVLCSQNSGSGDLKFFLGGVEVASIAHTSLPSAGSAPTYQTVNVTTEGNDWQLQTTNSFHARIFDVERIVANAQEATTVQDGTTASGTTNQSGQDEADAHDNDTGTLVFLQSDGRHVTLTFPEPAAAYDVQKIDVRIRMETITLKIKVFVDGANLFSNLSGEAEFGVSSLSFPSTKLYSFTTAFQGNVIRLEQEGNAVDFKVVEVDRTLITYGAPAAVGVEIEGANVGYNLRLLADVDGYKVPTATELVAGYDFDDSAGWSTDGATHAGESTIKVEGTESQTIEAAETQINAADSLTDWSVVDGTHALDTSDKVEGAASIQATANSSSGSCSNVYDPSGTIGDLTDKLILIDFKLTGATLGANDDVLIRLENTGVSFTGEWRMNGTQGAVIPFDTWVTFVGDYKQGFDSETGSFDPANIDAIRIQFNTPSPVASGVVLHIDNIRMVSSDPLLMQKNDLSTVDLDSPNDGYRVALRPVRSALLTEVDLRFSNTAGTGTTIPANHKLLTIPANTITDGIFRAIEVLAVDVGSPGTTSAVQTMQVGTVLIALHRTWTNPYIAAGEFRVYVDDLEQEDAISNPYSVAAGTLMENPADIARHWITAIGGAAVNDASFTNAETNLAAVKIAADLCGFGDRWQDILARLGFESRANFIAEELAAGTEWKMLTADASYQFPVAGGTISEWAPGGFVESELSVEGEAATVFMFFYDIDLSAAEFTDEAFRKIVVANPLTSDLVNPTLAEIQAAALNLGMVEAVALSFLGLHDDDALKDVAGYYAHERIRPARIYAVREVPWFQAYDREVGDIVNFTPSWSTSAIKARIIEYVKSNRTEQVELRLVEVD